jgi:phospholipid/cholesterol/gamma-HCH transport system substrate-binding protein
MVKETPSPLRVAAMVLFAASVVLLTLFLWLSFGGSIPLKPQSYRFTVAFPEAQTLAEEADVRMAGVNVGKVKKKELDKKADRTLVTIELKNQYAPISKATRTILRQKTLLGETYVELAPGKPGAPNLPDGGTLASSQVEKTVELDEIFNTFDRPTRVAFRDWVKELSVAIKNRSGDLNDSLGNLGPFATDGATLLKTLDEQGTAVRRLVKNTGVVFGALNQRQGALRQLVVNGNNTFAATASRDRALAETIRVFPTFLDESKATLTRLDSFSRETHPLVNQLKPAADDLGPTVRDLAALSPDLEGLFHDIPGLVRSSKKGLPALTSVVSGAEPLFEGAHVFLPQLNPILSEFNFHQATITGFLSGATADLAGTFGGKRYQTQVALLDPDKLLTTFRNEPASTRGNSYMQPNSLQRGYALGPVAESFHCPGGKELKDPNDAKKLPPCFVQPPSLLTGKQFLLLGKGQAPYRKPPANIEGTVPADPSRR